MSGVSSAPAFELASTLRRRSYCRRRASHASTNLRAASSARGVVAPEGRRLVHRGGAAARGLGLVLGRDVGRRDNVGADDVAHFVETRGDARAFPDDEERRDDGEEEEADEEAREGAEA